MSISFKIHGERLGNSGWSAVAARLETVSYGGRVVDSWLESAPLFIAQGGKLFNILRAIPSRSEGATSERSGFPQDVSNEVLRALPLRPENNDDFRSEFLHQSINFSPSWSLLEDLIDYDWNSKMMLWQGKVEARYACLFGDGQQPFPNECAKGLIQFRKNEDYQPFWSLGKEQAAQPEYSTVTWIESYDGNDYFETIVPIVDIIPKLKTFGEPECVRIIYWIEA